MAGTITSLVVQKNNKDRVNVFLDDTFAFGLNLNAALSLKKGQFLSDEEIAGLRSDDQSERAFQKALHFLSFRARTEQEIAQYLRKKLTAKKGRPRRKNVTSSENEPSKEAFSDEIPSSDEAVPSEQVVEEVIARLKQYGYLNDADFAQMWVRNRQNLKPKGRQALRYELRQKGIAEGDIEQALADVDEESLAWRAVESRLPRWRTLDEASFRKKVTGYLARRGFGYDVIDSVWRQAWDLLEASNGA